MTKPLKILIIGINYAPEIISTAVYTTGLAEFFVKKGHEISVITAQPYYPAWKVMEGWPRFLYRSETSEKGVNIVHCPLYVPAKPSGIKRIIHHISFALSALPVAIAKAYRNKPDIVLVIAPSLLSGPVGNIAAKVGGAKRWLHIQDYEVEAAFVTGLLKESSKIGRAAKSFESMVLHKFDKISSISQPMLEKLVEKGIPKPKIYELRNWANLSKVSVVKTVSPLKSEFEINTKFVALYSGNLANKQGLEILPELAKLLSHREDLTIVICGDGPMRDSLEQMSKDIRNIRFFPLQPLSKLSDLLGMADVHLLPQIAGAADLVLPSKLTNILASGRPVIATTDSMTALGQEIEGCGLLTQPGNATAMATALLEILDDTKMRQSMARSARLRAMERWDGEAILNRFEGEVLALCAEKETAQSS